jgi:uncharacterized membrane protein YdcZ (DUF606 family)
VVSFYGLLVGSKVILALLIGRSRMFLVGKGYRTVLRILAGILALFAFILIKDGFALLGISR